MAPTRRRNPSLPLTGRRGAKRGGYPTAPLLDASVERLVTGLVAWVEAKDSSRALYGATVARQPVWARRDRKSQKGNGTRWHGELSMHTHKDLGMELDAPQRRLYRGEEVLPKTRSLFLVPIEPGGKIN